MPQEGITNYKVLAVYPNTPIEVTLEFNNNQWKVL